MLAVVVSSSSFPWGMTGHFHGCLGVVFTMRVLCEFPPKDSLGMTSWGKIPTVSLHAEILRQLWLLLKGRRFHRKSLVRILPKIPPPERNSHSFSYAGSSCRKSAAFPFIGCGGIEKYSDFCIRTLKRICQLGKRSSKARNNINIVLCDEVSTTRV